MVRWPEMMVWVDSRSDLHLTTHPGQAVLVIRRTIVTVIYVVYFGSPYMRGVLLLIASFVFAAFSMFARPFVDVRDNDLEVRFLFVCLFAGGGAHRDRLNQ